MRPTKLTYAVILFFSSLSIVSMLFLLLTVDFTLRRIGGYVCGSDSIETIPSASLIWLATFATVVSVISTISSIILAWRSDRRDAREKELKIKQLERGLEEAKQNQLEAAKQTPATPTPKKSRKKVREVLALGFVKCIIPIVIIMKVYNPQDMNAAFAQAFNSGDIENLAALYEPGAVLVPRPGHVAEGAEAIRAALQELLALKGHMRSENQYALVSGDIALLRAKVHLVGTAPDGSRLEVHNHTAEVVRRQQDGSWLYILDHPYGADPLEASAG